MKVFTASCLLAALSAVPALAREDASPTVSYASHTTPAPSLNDSPDLELRQVAAGLVDPDAALTANQPAGAVTNYGINSQIGPGSGVYIDLVYTQLFSAVPDQWPTAKPGTIGMGDLAKRHLEPAATMVEETRVVQTGGFVQPVVVQMVTEIVAVPVRRATSVIVVETVTVANLSTMANGTIANSTAMGGNATNTASIEYGTSPPFYTARGR